ncbi:MAG TPA: M48 family metalloprotease [Steroidobacteraceae bacterium]|nr:M48 family metalloprotease [Steroidobacteraceae bacterium]
MPPQSGSGLLDTMRQEEIEAVLGHEVSHVASGDMVTGIKRLFMTHPPLEERIAALQAAA